MGTVLDRALCTPGFTEATPDKPGRPGTFMRLAARIRKHGCVEVIDSARIVLVRDTTDRDGGALGFTAGAWRRFTGSLR
jgi:hypothetical protein